MDQKLITTALGLPDGSTDRDILDRIASVRQAAGEDDIASLGDFDLIRRDEHERVSITADGAVVTLYYPLKSGTEVIEDLTIRRPTAKHMRRMQANKGTGIERGLALMVDLTGRAMSELENLDAADTTLCMHVCSFLQLPPRRTGSRS